MNDAELVEAARQAALGSYSPYSGFRVGAALLDSDGNLYTGANVENASYPVGSCAEATVVNHAVSTGARSFTVLAVSCLDADDVEGSYPCGRCRQIMSEFGIERILVTSDAGEVREHRLEELMPHGFRNPA
jgi:cytidine deaminase